MQFCLEQIRNPEFFVSDKFPALIKNALSVTVILLSMDSFPEKQPVYFFAIEKLMELKEITLI